MARLVKITVRRCCRSLPKSCGKVRRFGDPIGFQAPLPCSRFLGHIQHLIFPLTLQRESERPQMYVARNLSRIYRLTSTHELGHYLPQPARNRKVIAIFKGLLCTLIPHVEHSNTKGTSSEIGRQIDTDNLSCLKPGNPFARWTRRR